MKVEICTLCFMIRDGRILLGEKKVGFGMGKFNGFGGKVKAGEEIEKAAVREIKEECGLRASGLKKVGILHFSLPQRMPARQLEVHVFSVNKFEGEVLESREMRPEWFALGAIPYERMWPDDRHWLPLFLKGKKFRGTFALGNNDVILSQSLDVVNQL